MLGAPPVNWSRLLIVSLILLVSVFIQTKTLSVFGWTFDLVLVVLLVSALFLRFFELVFLVLLAFLAIAWSPGLSLEAGLLFVLPLGAFFVERFFSWELWVTNLVFVASSLLLFYLLLGPGQVVSNWLIILNDVVFSSFFAAILYFVLEYIYRSQFD